MRNWLGDLISPLAGRAPQRGVDSYESMSLRLIRAGYRSPDALRNYMGSRVAAAAGMSLGSLLTPTFFGITDERLAILVCVSAGLGFVLPGMTIDRSIKSRQKSIRETLPDAIDLMGVCVEAGLGMGATVMRVAREYAESNPILAGEFKLVVLEMQAGKSTQDALRGLTHRTGVSDLNSLVSMLIQTERFGTGLADTLRIHSEALRTRRLQRGEELAQKASIKMLMPAAFCIFPAILIIAVGPGVLRIFQTIGH
jgi:tight adherence protein C